MSRSLAKLLATAVALCLVAALPAAAQFANADLSGTIKDADGANLPGVTVTAQNEETGVSRTTISYDTGSYVFNGLRPGSYRISFALDGFQGKSVPGVKLLVGQKADLDVTLDLGTVEEAIVVTAAVPLIETDSKEIGGTLTSEEFEVLPSRNRSALLFAALLPGVTPSPDTESTSSDSLFINGQTDFNNSFNIDGANNDDDVIGAIAGAQTRTSIEAIQEFQVLTTQFDAEFGRALGGVLNAVTKAGTNRFKGSVWGYRQDNSLNDEDFITEFNDLEEADTSFENIGFNLGGPIIDSKLHFFTNFEDISDQEGIARSFSSRPEFNFTTTEDNSIENFIGRLDFQANESHHIALRFLREQSPQFNQIIGGQITLDASREEDDTDSNWIISLDSLVSNTAINTARLSFTKEDVAFANPGFNNNGQSFAAQRNLEPFEDRPGIDLGNSTVATARVNRSTQLDDTFSFVLPDWAGSHDFRVGFQYSEREEELNNFGLANGDFTFDTTVPFNPDDIDTYPLDFLIRVGGPLTGDIPDNEVLGIFAQDDWQISDNLTLNLGLRLDDESITDDTNIAPRVGFSWDVSGEGKMVVRGGVGRFYDRLPLFLFDDFFQDSISISSGFTQRFPSAGADQQLFFDLAQANGIRTLRELRDFLAAMLEGSAGTLLNVSPTVDNPDREQPYLDSYSIGFQRSIRRDTALTVDLVHARNRKALVRVDLNPFSSAMGGRPNLSIFQGQPVNLNSITTPINAGEREYTALQGSIQKRFTGNWGGRLSVTYSDADGNYDGDPGDFAFFQSRTETGFNFDTGQFIGATPAANLNDPRNDQAAQFDRDWNIVLSGQYRVPKTSWRDNGGLVVSGLFRYLSGDRFTIIDNSARLDNGNRAPAAPGSFDGTGTIGRQGISFNGSIAGSELPSFTQLDVALQYRIPLNSRFKIALLADVFNILDKVNFANIGGTRVGANGFLTPTAVRSARAIQIGVRLDF